MPVTLSITLDFQCDIQFAVNAITPSDLLFCMFQAKLPEESFPGSPDKIVHNQNVNIPPASHLIADLEPHSLYAVRVACHSSQGSSDWSPWVEFRTKQGGEAAKCGGVCAVWSVKLPPLKRVSQGSLIRGPLELQV